MEKWSEQDKRIELVNKFKDKILKEIETILKRDLELFKVFSDTDIENSESDQYHELEYLTKEMAICLFMRRWISKQSFLSFVKASKEDDTIIYRISSRHLKLWSQEDYPFMWLLIDKYGLKAVNLNESMLEYDFTNVIDEALFTKKVENNNL